jgi:hypothetical protein
VGIDTVQKLSFTATARSCRARLSPWAATEVSMAVWTKAFTDAFFDAMA